MRKIKKKHITKSNVFDIIIVGAGPAGIFACYEILQKKPEKKIALIEMGNRIENRAKNELMTGFGGAGTYSDGKLHYTPVLSHEKAFHLIEVDDYQRILDEIEIVFRHFGVDSEFYPKDTLETKNLVEESEKQNIELVIRKIQHVGTDKLKNVIREIQNYFEKSSVTIIDKTKIVDLITEKNTCRGVKDIHGKRYFAKKILLAPGRISSRWLQEISSKYGIRYQYETVEVGVRVEFPESVMRKFSENLYEAILKVRTPTYDDVIRTFCPCPNGFVAVETYQGYICVNGHSQSDHLSKNSNFAFVCEVDLTEPVENSTAYAESIARVVSTIGGNKPILQRLDDLRNGRRSTWGRIKKSIVKPTCKEVTPGDISMALPHRVVKNILEGLEKLDTIMPGINSGSTLLYAPEVKYRGSRVVTGKNLETKVHNLFVAGDGAGVSGNIIGAAATGVMAARGILH